MSASRWWHGIALLAFVAALLSLFHPLWNHDLGSVVLTSVPTAETPAVNRNRADHRWVVWVVARNARTLSTAPTRLFDAEQCHPAKRSLAYGEPAITLGLVGVPAWLATRDPFVTFNCVWLAITLLAALAMYLLVRDWTGVPAAGIVAGLLYAFHASKVSDATHPYLGDNAWTVVALFFAHRLFQGGRWRDAAGLAIGCALQIGGSFYPLLGAVALAVPLAAWWLWRYGLREVRALQWVALAVVVGVTGFLVFGPYLDVQSAGGLRARAGQFHLPWLYLAPGSPRFPGWTLLGLAAAGLMARAPHGRGTDGGNARWALLAGAILSLALATGGTAGDQLVLLSQRRPLPVELPNLWRALEGVLPGLAVVRAPGQVYVATHLALCVLAGLGAGALLRRAPARVAPWLAAMLIAVAFAETLHPAGLETRAAARYEVVALRPSDEEIGFFRRLAALGDTGPILEIPDRPRAFTARTTGILLSAYHHRPTSWCHASFLPSEVDEVARLAARLPSRAAILAVRERGFATIVVHHPMEAPAAQRVARAFENFARGTHGALLQRLHRTDSMTAWRLAPEGAGVR